MLEYDLLKVVKDTNDVVKRYAIDIKLFKHKDPHIHVENFFLKRQYQIKNLLFLSFTMILKNCNFPQFKLIKQWKIDVRFYFDDGRGVVIQFDFEAIFKQPMTDSNIVSAGSTKALTREMYEADNQPAEVMFYDICALAIEEISEDINTLQEE